MSVLVKYNPTEAGGILVSTVILMSFVGVMGAAVIEQTNTDKSSNLNELQSFQALHIGNGGIEYALERLNQGENPAIQNKAFALGEFTINATPETQTLFVNALVGDAKKALSLTTDFSEQCVAEDETAAFAQNKSVNGMELTQSCHKRSVITAMKVEWNSSNCVQSLDCAVAESNKEVICHVPPGNPANQHSVTVSDTQIDKHLDHGDILGPCTGSENSPAPALVCTDIADAVAACGDDTGGAQVKSIRIDNTWVVQNVAADPGTVIDVEDFIMLAGETYEISEIIFDRNLPNETWYDVTVYYADGSTEKMGFKFDE